MMASQVIGLVGLVVFLWFGIAAVISTGEDIPFRETIWVAGVFLAVCVGVLAVLGLFVALAMGYIVF